MSNKERISELLKIDLEVIEKLFNEGLIDPRGISKYLLCSDFKELKKQKPEAKNLDLYTELSIKYNLSESAVYKWVNNYKN